jgi:hypothetical protein
MVPHDDEAKEGTGVNKLAVSALTSSAISIIIAIIIIRCGAPPGALLVV